MKKIICLFIVSSFLLPLFADNSGYDLMHQFNKAGPQTFDEYDYQQWGYIKKDKDDILDVIVRSYESKYRVSCEWFSKLNINKHIVFLMAQETGIDFILKEPCHSSTKNLVVFIKGFVSSYPEQGNIEVYQHGWIDI